MGLYAFDGTGDKWDRKNGEISDTTKTKKRALFD